MTKQPKPDPRMATVDAARTAISELWRVLLLREHCPMRELGLPMVNQMQEIVLPHADEADRAKLVHLAAAVEAEARDETNRIVRAAARVVVTAMVVGDELLPSGWSVDAGRRLTATLMRSMKAGDLPRDAEREVRPLLDDAELWLDEVERRIEVTALPTTWVPASRYRDKADRRVASLTAVRRFAAAHNVPTKRPSKGRVQLLLDDGAMRRALEGNRRHAWNMADQVQRRAKQVREAKAAPK